MPHSQLTKVFRTVNIASVCTKDTQIHCFAQCKLHCIAIFWLSNPFVKMTNILVSEASLIGWCVLCCWLKYCTATISLCTISDLQSGVHSVWHSLQNSSPYLTQGLNSLSCYTLSFCHIIPAEHFDLYCNIGVHLKYLLSPLWTLIIMLSSRESTWPADSVHPLHSSNIHSLHHTCIAHC